MRDHRAADEARTLRRRITDLTAALDRHAAEVPGAGAACLVQTVTVASYPIASPKVFAVKAVTLSVAEAEGATPTFAQVGGVFYIVSLGGTVPPVGTTLLAEFSGGKWVASF